MNKKYIQKNYINLCSPVIGTKIYDFSDQFFGLASRLLKDEPPVFKDGVYDKNGKWMDGWETRRKRVKGNDFVIIKLGLPGMISFAEIDTSFFNGNQPQYASIDACYIDNKTKKFNWSSILSKQKLKPDAKHGFKINKSKNIYNYIRLNIYPDGGVARLKLLGDVVVDKINFSKNKFDLLSVLKGSKIVACSDEHFGKAENLLLPFKSKNMGNGWETKRRRGAGFDWVIIKLGKPGFIENFDIQTHYFKGNFPSYCSIQYFFSNKNININSIVNSSKKWEYLVKHLELKAHSSIKKQLSKKSKKINYLKLNIYPDGGISRIRSLGKIV